MVSSKVLLVVVTTSLVVALCAVSLYFAVTVCELSNRVHMPEGKLAKLNVTLSVLKHELASINASLVDMYSRLSNLSRVLSNVEGRVDKMWGTYKQATRLVRNCIVVQNATRTVPERIEGKISTILDIVESYVRSS